MSEWRLWSECSTDQFSGALPESWGDYGQDRPVSSTASPLQPSGILACCDFGPADLTRVSISEGKHIISGHAQCHLEGSSGFPKWKQHALKVIMGQEAFSGLRPSIYEQRSPFLPGDSSGISQPQWALISFRRACSIRTVEHTGVGKSQGLSPELLGALSGVENSVAEDDSLTLEVDPRTTTSGITCIL